MKIAQNSFTCNGVGKDLLDSLNISSGNIIPHWWYTKILTIGGKADTIAIALLSELWFLYRCTGQEQHQKDYNYFCNKFNLSQFQIREAFIRLESLGLMNRSIGSVVVQGRKFANILFVTLHVNELLSMAPSQVEQNINDDDNQGNVSSKPWVNNSKEIASDISNSDVDKILSEEETKFESNNKPNADFDELGLAGDLSEFSDPGVSNFIEISSDISNPNIDKRISIRKNRSRSNASNFNLSELELVANSSSAKNLSEFYPLSANDAELLQIKSGREFDLNFINQLMLRLADKYPNRKFNNKKAVLSYMSQLLTHELRQAVIVNNVNFKFKSSKDLSATEQYLHDIEMSLENDLASQLRRKIAASFSKQTALELLQESEFKHESSGEFLINTKLDVILTGHQRQTLIEQVRSVYGNTITNLRIEPKTQPINKRDIQQHHNQIPKADLMNLGINKAVSCDSNIHSSVWGKVRAMLTSYYGEAVDRSWFSKLTAVEDSEAKLLNIKAPSHFLRDWVENNYQTMIRVFCEQQGYRLGQFT